MPYQEPCTVIIVSCQKPASIAHSTVISKSDGRPRGCRFESQFGHIHVTYVEIDKEINEIISMVIILIWLIPEGKCQLLAKLCAQSTG